jgi:IclR family transcriptional regulator, acetate operon repressor
VDSSSGAAVRLLSHVENRPAVGAQVLDRTVVLLSALADAGAPVAPAALAARCDLPPSTTYRLLADLEVHGLVVREGRRGVTLGLRVLGLARSLEDRLEETLVQPAREVLQALARAHGETALLTAPGGTHAMCLASVESPQHAVRLSYDRWRTAPMHLGASGKVLLAHLDDAHAERILAAPPPHPADGPQIAVATLRAQIAATRRDGHLVTHGELDAGATAVAAPVLDPRGRPVAAVSVAGPTERMRPALAAIVPAVCDGARAIAERVGAR